MPTSLKSVNNSGGIIQLAPDLTYFTDSVISTQPHIHRTITGIDGTAGLAVALSLSGSWFISSIMLGGIGTSQNIGIELTIDGSLIINDLLPLSSNIAVYNQYPTNYTSGSVEPPFGCVSSLLLRVSSVSANAMSINFIARPITI